MEKKILRIFVIVLLLFYLPILCYPTIFIAKGETESLNIQLYPDWNLISSPYETTLGDLIFEYNNDSYTYTEAVSEGLIYSIFYYYDPDGYQYFYNSSDVLTPGLGYRVQAYEQVNCIISGDVPSGDLNIDLKPGYTTLGWIHEETITAQDIMDTIPGCSYVSILEDHVEQEDGSLNYTIYRGNQGDTNFNIVQGVGFWIETDESSTWDGYIEEDIYQLEMQVPDTVEESSIFQVTITSDGSLVSDVNIYFRGQYYTTNNHGISNITSGSVNLDTIYPITASKFGYKTADDSVIVTNIAEPSELVIFTPLAVVEENVFQVFVSAEGLPIQDVSVTIFNISHKTSIDGSVTFIAPDVDNDTSYMITAVKEGYLSDQEFLTVLNNDIDIINELEIFSPPFIKESNEFEILVLSNNIPIEDVDILFDDKPFKTSNQGTVKLTAPTVTKDTYYTIVASKDGFNTKSLSINILNEDETKYSNILGTIFDGSGRLLSNVKVCVAQQNLQNMKNCMFTNQFGQYSFRVEIGNSYIISATKEGYNSLFFENNVIETTQDYIFNITMIQKAVNVSKTLVDYTLESKILSGNIAAQIDVNETKAEVDVYDEEINIEINAIKIGSDELVSFNLSAEESTPSTMLAVSLGDVNPKNIVIKYDGVTINETDNVISFFNEINRNKEYVLFSSNDELIVVINIPKFSEHQIVIYSIEEIIDSIGGTTALILYSCICAISTIVFVGVIILRKRI